MTPDRKLTEKMLPVFVGYDQEHILGRATIDHQSLTRSPTGKIVEPESVTITITATGREARLLAEFVASPEPVALSFAGIPVEPRKQIKKEN